MHIREETSVTSKVRAACGEGGKDLENISSAVLNVFSTKNTSIFIINPRPRLFLRGALLFEYLKHEKHVFDLDRINEFVRLFKHLILPGTKLHQPMWEGTPSMLMADR